LALLPAALLSAGCGTATSPTTTPGSTARAADHPTELTVGAATSLSEALSDLGPSVTAAHPGTSLTFAFDASSSLVRQLEAGAPLDVLVTADEATMAAAVERGLVVDPAVSVARNRLTLVVPEGNPADVTGLADLARLDVVALCGAEVPCGRAAERVLAAAGVALDPSHVTRGQNVRSTLTAVSEGGAQAGLVYATDAVVAADVVDEVPAALGPEGEVTAMAAVTTTADDPTAADAYLTLLRGEAGRAALAARGFGLP
jgi:molybdate transport system substrate-binding protein